MRSWSPTAGRHDRRSGSADRWPAWLGAVGFLAAVLAASALAAMAAGGVALVTGSTQIGSPGFTIAATVLQDGAFVATAVLVARLAGPVRPADLGLRPTSVLPAAAGTVAAGLAFYGFTVGYQWLVRPVARQRVLEAMGVADGTPYLIVGAALVVVLAPVAEEILFRGFLYRSLRNGLGPAAAAVTVGTIFGAVHYDGPESLGVIAPLAVLGVALCALYERTGSLYPAIVLHSVNNAVAFAFMADERGAALAAGAMLAVTVTACVGLAARQSIRRHA